MQIMHAKDSSLNSAYAEFPEALFTLPGVFSVEASEACYRCRHRQDVAASESIRRRDRGLEFGTSNR